MKKVDEGCCESQARSASRKATMRLRQQPWGEETALHGLQNKGLQKNCKRDMSLNH